MKIMKITEKNINDIEVIAISGRIDVISAKDLETFVDGIIDNNSRIVFDLEDTEYIRGFRTSLD